MLEGLLLAAAFAAPPAEPVVAARPAEPVVLPASPEAVAVGDIDQDGRPELVVLLVWPEWGSATVNRSPDPATYEVDVVPALRDRRELRAFEVEGERLIPAAPPLGIGREVLGIGPASPPAGSGSAPAAGGAVRASAGSALAPFALTDDGVARLRLEAGPDGTRVLRVVPDVAVAHALRGAERLVGLRPFLRAGRIVLPTSAGFAIVEPDGRQVTHVAASFREVDSGRAGSVRYRMPRLVDVDRDGRLDLLEVSTEDAAAVFRGGLGDGRGFGPPTRWDVAAALPPLPADKQAAGVERDLVDVLDADGDGTLDAVVIEKQRDFEGLRAGMKAIRGVAGTCTLHRLRPDGTVDPEPHARFTTDGHGLTFEHPDAWDSAFRDLDGDGAPELLTLTVRFGWFGAARALTTKAVKAGLEPRVYRRDPAARAWREVPDAAPRFDMAADLDNFDLARFFRIPGDVDGDGRAEMVQIDGRTVQVFPGEPGGRFGARPSATLRLEDRVRDVLGVVFTDVDGDGRLELLAFEELPREEDEPARRVRMELRRLDGGGAAR